jgi:hypothetical protein
VNGRDVVRRISAYAEGRPLPSGATIHLATPPDDDVLVMALVRMGGESLPWAIGVGHPGRKPEIFSVPDPRVRDDVAAMLTKLTPRLCAHFDSPQYSGSGVSSEDSADDVPVRQLWLPNGAHVDLLHMLNQRYTFARAGDPERAANLRALGRLCGFLFREAGRVGEATIIDATTAMREAFTFPADDLRQQHLGFLLALMAGGMREERLERAEQAEEESVSTSLDPDLERDPLEAAVGRYTAARREENVNAMASAAQEIATVLEGEVTRRLELTMTAIETLRSDPRPVNPGAELLGRTSTAVRQRDHLWLEEQLIERGEFNDLFPPSPETDRDPATGAARYHRHAGAADEAAGALIHYDSELQEDAIASGDALRCVIRKVENQSATKRGVIPVWTVEADSSAPTRLRKGSAVCVAGVPKRTGSVLAIGRDNGVRRIEIEIKNWKAAPNAAKHPDFAHVRAAADPLLEGEEIMLLPTSLAGIGARKSIRARSKDGVGAWLTHGTGLPPTRRRKNGRADLLAEIESLRTP